MKLSDIHSWVMIPAGIMSDILFKHAHYGRGIPSLAKPMVYIKVTEERKHY